MSAQTDTILFLSTPSVRRATRRHDRVHQFRAIPIHALREEGDTVIKDVVFEPEGISIHALREEGDISTASGRLQTSNFYPRPP